jgi:predicted secreted protein
MTLLTTVFAAIICTIIWYKNAPKSEMKVGSLCWMYWGASLMWLIDAIFEYAELGADFFVPDPINMLNDLYLGLSVVALGLIIWLVILLIKDPKGVVKAALFKKK